MTPNNDSLGAQLANGLRAGEQLNFPRGEERRQPSIRRSATPDDKRKAGGLVEGLFWPRVLIHVL